MFARSKLLNECRGPRSFNADSCSDHSQLQHLLQICRRAHHGLGACSNEMERTRAYERHGASVHRYACELCGPERADEVTPGSLLRIVAFTGRSSFDPSRSRMN